MLPCEALGLGVSGRGGGREEAVQLHSPSGVSETTFES